MEELTREQKEKYAVLQDYLHPATKAEGSTFTPQDYRIKLVSAIAVDSYSTKHVSSVENMEKIGRAHV